MFDDAQRLHHLPPILAPSSTASLASATARATRRAIEDKVSEALARARAFEDKVARALDDDDLKRSAQLVQTRLYSRWVSWGRFLPAHVRHTSLVPSLHEHASDCFAALSECKTRGKRAIVVVCFGLKAFLMIADCYRVAIQTRLCNEILGITSVFLRK